MRRTRIKGGWMKGGWRETYLNARPLRCRPLPLGQLLLFFQLGLRPCFSYDSVGMLLGKLLLLGCLPLFSLPTLLFFVLW